MNKRISTRPPRTSYDAVLYRKRPQDKRSRIVARGGLSVLLAYYSERPEQARPEYSLQLGDRVCEHKDLEAMIAAAGLLKE
jgi:hypothetical protein